MKELAFVLAGVAAGIFSGGLGVGGALLATPAIRLLGVTPYLAIGTTVPVMLPTVLTGAWAYRKEGLVDLRAAIATGLPAAATAVAGAGMTRAINGHYLMLATAAVIFVLAVRMIRGSDEASETPQATNTWVGFALLGVLTGFVSGLLGIGGGFLLVPVYIRLYRFPIRLALGTSLAAISILLIPNIAAQAWVGNIDWRVALFLSFGVVPGAAIGARLAIRARERAIRVALVTSLVVVALIYAGGELAALFVSPR